MNRKPTMTFEEALDFADSLDLPEGAAMAMAEEISGTDSATGCAEIAARQQLKPKIWSNAKRLLKRKRVFKKE